jgi:hypothetical protein
MLIEPCAEMALRSVLPSRIDRLVGASIALPRIALPRISLPRLALTGIALPWLALARITLPRVSLPRITLPRVSLPWIATSRIRRIWIARTRRRRRVCRHLAHTTVLRVLRIFAGRAPVVLRPRRLRPGRLRLRAFLPGRLGTLLSLYGIVWSLGGFTGLTVLPLPA